MGDLGALLELTEEDPSFAEELQTVLHQAEVKVVAFELKKMMGAEEDQKNAIVVIQAGAGGTEAQDWAQMLWRMYERWAQRHQFRISVLDVQAGEEAGIKNLTAMISGPQAYGFLRSEAGVHRLVRISPFDSNARRHTSFASVFVSPEVEEDFEVVIQPSDLRIDVFRAGGKGGQGVNTTDSAVRITHLPTGIAVVCQQERSQLKNKDLAMKVLRSRLYERHLEAERQKQEALEESKKEIGWGSQIRSYVLYPYQLVKDHRTGQASSLTQAVLDGDPEVLDAFMKSYLSCCLNGRWARSGEGGGED